MPVGLSAENKLTMPEHACDAVSLLPAAHGAEVCYW